MIARKPDRSTGSVRALSFLTGTLAVGLMFVAAIASPILAGQNAKPADESQPELKTFVGTWKATFHGETLAILTLREQNGHVSGTLNNFDVVFDKDGNLTDDSHADSGDAPLLNVRFKSGALYFFVFEKDQYRPGMNWKFLPTSATEGELTPVLEHQEDAPKDLVVKPIRMEREHPKR